MIDPVKTERLRRAADELIDAIDAFQPRLDVLEQARLEPYYGDARTEARDLLVRLDPDNYPDMPEAPEPAPVPVAPVPVAPVPVAPPVAPPVDSLEAFRREAALRVLERVYERYGVAEDVRHAVAMAYALVIELGNPR